MDAYSYDKVCAQHVKILIAGYSKCVILDRIRQVCASPVLPGTKQCYYFSGPFFFFSRPHEHDVFNPVL